MNAIAFVTTYTGTGAQVTRWGDEWPDEIQLHVDMWRQMLERKCLPWAVANLHVGQIETGLHSDRLTFVPGRKDGRVQFSMSDGQWAEYSVTAHDEGAGIYTLQRTQYGYRPAPVLS